MSDKSTRPILIFYHCALNYPDRVWAMTLIREQMEHLKSVGLTDSAKEIVIGMNGDDNDMFKLREVVGEKPIILPMPKDLWPSGEVGTMRAMAEIIQGHAPSHVLYFHTKGLSFPPGHGLHEHRRDWRKSMSAVVIDRWRECVALLEQGHESVGNWWNIAFNGQYWAGNFFWVTSEFLLTLPYLDIKDQNEGGRYEAEVWIGRGPRLPRYVSL